MSQELTFQSGEVLPQIFYLEIPNLGLVPKNGSKIRARNSFKTQLKDYKSIQVSTYLEDSLYPS